MPKTRTYRKFDKSLLSVSVCRTLLQVDSHTMVKEYSPFDQHRS